MEELSKRIIELDQELRNDVKLTELNIKEQALKAPGIKAKWACIMAKEQRHLKILKKTKKRLLDEYVEKHGMMGVNKLRTEHEAKSSEKIVKIDKLIDEQYDVIRYMEDIMKIMHSYGYEISNTKDLIKMEI